MSGLLRINHAAVWFGFSIDTVRRLSTAGVIPTVHYGKQRRYSLEALQTAFGTKGPLLRSGKVAAMLGLATQTVNRLAGEGKIPAIDFGSKKLRRFRREDVERIAVEGY